MRPPSDSKTLLLRSSRWGGAGAGGTPAGRASCSPPFSWAVRREHYSSPRLTTTVRSGAIRPLSTAGFPLPEESGGWDPSPRCRCYQACQSDSRRRLFTQVRGRGILGSPFAGSWIRPRNTPVQRPRTGPIGVRGGRYYRGLDRYANLFFVIFGDGHVAPTFRVVAPKYLMG